ncbi:MAG TPA: LysR family transcriptional regulator [Mycobacterium sp.]|nr:LysR family transcriptional regulator [Mycobacterium sp.]
MELRELRGFVAVVDEGALSAAARRMHLSQPALSQMVSGLERELGLQLLVRDGPVRLRRRSGIADRGSPGATA